MKNLRITIALSILAVVGTMAAQNAGYMDDMAARLDIDVSKMPSECDTVVSRKGTDVHVVLKNGRVESIGRRLFPDVMKTAANTDMLSFVEAAVLARIAGMDIAPINGMTIHSGSIRDLKALSPETDCETANRDARTFGVVWTLPEGRKVAVSVPVSYHDMKGRSRGDIESDFIAGLKAYAGGRKYKMPKFGIEDLQPHGEDLFVLKGKSYHIPQVNTDIFLVPDKDGNAVAVCDTAYPAESVADVFLVGNAVSGKTPVEMDILLHEYGEKQKETTTLDNLIGYCLGRGCEMYWGMNRVEPDGTFKGALFFYSPQQGYDHIFRISGNVKSLLDGSAPLKSRVSLFVPTNNVDNLFEQYKKKAPEERINYNR